MSSHRVRSKKKTLMERKEVIATHDSRNMHPSALIPALLVITSFLNDENRASDFAV